MLVLLCASLGCCLPPLHKPSLVALQAQPAHGVGRWASCRGAAANATNGSPSTVRALLAKRLDVGCNPVQEPGHRGLLVSQSNGSIHNSTTVSLQALLAIGTVRDGIGSDFQLALCSILPSSYCVPGCDASLKRASTFESCFSQTLFVYISAQLSRVRSDVHGKR